MTPDRTLRRGPVAGLAVTITRDDVEGERSYVLLVDRSYFQSLYDCCSTRAPSSASRRRDHGIELVLTG